LVLVYANICYRLDSTGSALIMGDEGRPRCHHATEASRNDNCLCAERGVSMYQTNMYEGLLSETITIRGANGHVINAYYARPLGGGPFPGMVLIHHAPGWDEWYR